MIPIEVEITPVSIYGVLIHDDEIKPKRKWLKEFFSDLVEESDNQGKLTDLLLYHWKQKLYSLSDEAGLYILDKPDCLDYYLGVIPLWPWDRLEMRKHITEESAFEAIADFLNTYFDLTQDELGKLKKEIKFHNTVFMTKGE